MSEYDEAKYWERRYARGGHSGQVLEHEHAYLVDQVSAIAGAYAPKSILDVGVGDGRLATRLLSALPTSIEYIGADISGSALDRVARVTRGRARTLVIDAAESVPVRADVVLCFNVLYHISDPARADAVIRHVLAAARSAAAFVAWNERVREFGELAAHCHYRPFRVAQGSGFREVRREAFPHSPHKTLHVLERVE